LRCPDFRWELLELTQWPDPLFLFPLPERLSQPQLLRSQRTVFSPGFIYTDMVAPLKETPV